MEKPCRENNWGGINILNRLVGSKLDISRSVLNAIFKVYIKPVLKYGCEALTTVTPAILNTLEVI
jgi:hypothetical protein